MILLGSIEALKAQRDLYVAFRDLFIRHDSQYFLWAYLSLAGLKLT